MNNRKNTGRSFAGKGYYIALILCAVAIGISGYLYYRNAGSDDAALKDTPVNVENDAGIEAMGTQSTSAGDSNAPTTGKPLKTGLPVAGETVVNYAMDSLCYNSTTRDWRVHDGIDIAATAGTLVTAAADGVVYTTYEDDAMGTTVVIRHEGGYVTTYSSLDADVSVAAGDSVKLGQAIGYVGSSAMVESAIGDHVHFCVSLNDESIDPEAFLELG